MSGLPKFNTRSVGEELRELGSFSLVQRLGNEKEVISLLALDEGIMLAGTHPDGEIWRSTDFGASWTLIKALGETAGQRVVYALEYLGTSIVLAGMYEDGVNAAIYRSTDNGLTWSFASYLGTNSYARCLVYLRDGIVIAGTIGSTPGGEIYRSTDNGVTWTLIQQLGDRTYVESLSYLGDDIVVAGAGKVEQGASRIYRSTNAGLTWSLIQSLGVGHGVRSMLYLGNGICLAGESWGGTTALPGQIWRTSDYGLTWTAVQTLGGVATIYAMITVSYGTCLASGHPSAELWISRDYGFSWSLLQRLNFRGNVYARVFLCVGNKVVLAGTGAEQAEIWHNKLDEIKNSADLIGHVDGLEGKLAGGLPAALDSGALKVKEQSPLTTIAVTQATASSLKAEIHQPSTKEVFHVDTSGGINILVDKLTQSATDERRVTVSNDGTRTTYTIPTGDERRGKLFPRGCRGFLGTVDVYCKDGASSGGTITVYLSPLPGTGYVYKATVTVPAGVDWGWISATFNIPWPWDTMFIFSVGSSVNMWQGLDVTTPYDFYASADAGVTWTIGDYRTYFRAILKGATVGDVPVSGVVAVEKAPVRRSGVLTGDTAVKAAPGLVCWITCEAGASASVFQLNNSTDNSGTDLWQAKVPANDTRHFVFDPPLPFDVGIYLDADANIGSCTVGYE